MVRIATVNPNRIVRGRCALCRCRAKAVMYGIRVCTYHVAHGESDPPCPYCHQYRLFDPRWTYTVNGAMPPKKVQVRQVNLPNTIFFDSSGELALSIISVKEPTPKHWPSASRTRRSVVMIGVGLQLGTQFTITQWASDWERELLDAARPTLALAHRIYVLSKSSVHILAGDGYALPPFWPTMNVRDKAFDVKPFFHQQDIRPNARENDIEDERSEPLWRKKAYDVVWRHNYLDVLDLSMRVFQIEWPNEEEP